MRKGLIRRKFVFAVCMAALVALLLPTAALAAPILADSFPVSNFSGTDMEWIPSDAPASGQTFTAIAGTVDSAAFYLKNNLGCTDNVWAEVYAITGTPGSNAVPTGAPIASSTHINASTIGSSYSLVTFSFNNSVTLTAGTNYAIVVRRDGSGPLIYVGTSTGPADTGNNMAWDTGSWVRQFRVRHDLLRVRDGAGRLHSCIVSLEPRTGCGRRARSHDCGSVSTGSYGEFQGLDLRLSSYLIGGSGDSSRASCSRRQARSDFCAGDAP